MQRPDLDSLESRRGTRIVGGIAFDHGNTIENNLKLLEANKILNELKKS